MVTIQLLRKEKVFLHYMEQPNVNFIGLLLGPSWVQSLQSYIYQEGGKVFSCYTINPSKVT